MITRIINSDHYDAICHGICKMEEFRGKSTDTKPNACTNGSIFYEMDTKKVFMWDAETKTWIEQ